MNYLAYILVFFILAMFKIGDFISWPWIWVTLPLWGPPVVGIALSILFIVFSFLFLGGFALLAAWFDR